MVLPSLRKWKDNYKYWQESNAKKSEENIVSYKTQHKEESSIESVQIAPVVEEVAIPTQQELKVANEETNIKEKVALTQIFCNKKYSRKTRCPLLKPRNK